MKVPLVLEVPDSCHPEANNDTIYVYTKFNDSSFSHAGDMTGAPKVKKDHVILTTLLSTAVCHFYFTAWQQTDTILSHITLHRLVLVVIIKIFGVAKLEFLCGMRRW